MMNGHKGEKSVAAGKEVVVQLVLRFVSLVASVVAFSSMLTASQSSAVSIFGFQVDVSSQWSYSYAFECLFGVSVAAAAYSLLQLLISGTRLLRKVPVIPSRSHAWLIFALDQVFAYAMLSAGSAAVSVTNLNRTGIKLAPLPSFCTALYRFCDHITISIVFTFFSSLLLAASVLQDVIWFIKS
ncbi:CASP-like protein 3A1 [Mangifera indica]|uniref:CASP-like protein 3A1 n=1 Tax=Mangifera indica TaxID=29780 RepID=UPI001CF9F8E5|nr:CASP-like protein 3A1 [Mangifera indica]